MPVIRVRKETYEKLKALMTTFSRLSGRAYSVSDVIEFLIKEFATPRRSVNKESV